MILIQIAEKLAYEGRKERKEISDETHAGEKGEGRRKGRMNWTTKRGGTEVEGEMGGNAKERRKYGVQGGREGGGGFDYTFTKTPTRSTE